MHTKYEDAILKILQDYQTKNISESEAITSVKALNVLDRGFATLDQSRSLRQRSPEVDNCAGKTMAQVVVIIAPHLPQHDKVLGTRATAAMYEAVKAKVPDAVYDEQARMIMVERQPLPKDASRVIAVVTAGTSDIPVAEEAALTAAIMGNKVQRIYDVGVAGLNRVMARVEDLRQANVIIVIAGMEGALASVVGGLVAKPVLAVPTSVGYGANFQGLSALLGMLNSCSGVAVVNIDNGFGAGRLASIINHLR